MAYQLDRGAIQRAYNNDTRQQPLLQIVDVKKMTAKNGKLRYRLVVSDGERYQQAMLATQLNGMVDSGGLVQYCVCRLNNFIVNVVAKRKIIICLGLDIVDSSVSAIIGNPTPIAPPGNQQNVPPNAQNVPPNNPTPQNYGGPPGGPSPSGFGGSANNSSHGGRANHNSGPGGSSGGGTVYGRPEEKQKSSRYNGGSSVSGSGYGRGNSGSGSVYGGGRPSGSAYGNNRASRPGNGNNGGYGGGGGAYGGGRGSGYNMRGGGARTSYNAISTLNPYQNKWVIKARVTHKGTMRTWNNSRGEGKLFSVELLDRNGGQIRATMFNDAADKFDKIFHEGKVYTISKGALKPANKKYNKLPHEFEMTLNRDADVQFVGEDQKIKEQLYNFTPISAYNDLINEHVDCIGVVLFVSQASQIVSSKTQKELTKRVIQIADDSNYSIDLTLWNEKADMYDEKALPPGTVVAIKAVKVGEYNGRSLSTTFQSTFQVNPNVPEAGRLQNWYHTTGANGVQALTNNAGGGMAQSSRRITMGDIDELKQMLQEEGKVEYFEIDAMICYVKNYDLDRPPWYTACPKEKCNKKVTEIDQGQWHCEKCGQSYGERKLRYILSICIVDNEGSQWVTAFNDEVALLVGKTAEELNTMIENNEGEAFQQALEAVKLQRMIFSCRAKMEMVQEEMRIRVTVTKCRPVDPIEEGRRLLEKISMYDNL